MFVRHKFLLVTVKEWLKSVLNYRSYPKNKSGGPFFLDHPVVWLLNSLTDELRGPARDFDSFKHFFRNNLVQLSLVQIEHFSSLCAL